MIVLKSEDEIKRIAEACMIVAEILEMLKNTVEKGMKTKEIEKLAEDEILRRKGKPAFKGYRGFPASICVSLNNQVVHGIPSETVIMDGDIVSMDLGVNYRGFFGDAALTIPIGEVSDDSKRLLRVTEEALYIGMDRAVVGNRISDISNSIEQHVNSNGFSVVRDFVGHGIGMQLHEEPQIPNFGPPGRGVRLREGMTLAIEPMVNAGTHDVVVLDDGWTAVTADGSLSAHFEHTIAITNDGVKVLTKIN